MQNASFGKKYKNNNKKLRNMLANVDNVQAYYLGIINNFNFINDLSINTPMQESQIDFILYLSLIAYFILHTKNYVQQYDYL